MVIADFGSGNTCHNDVDYVHRMIDEFDAANSHGREVVIKWQLFEPASAPHCTALQPSVFDEAYEYAAKKGYETTASVFDKWSLDLLLEYDVPFVKIACREWCYPLIDQIPRMTVVSVGNRADALRYMKRENVYIMACVPEYPARIGSYELAFTDLVLRLGISDHCSTPYMWYQYRPGIYERHFCLDDSTGPDAGSFAARPEEWKGILA